MKIEIAKGQDFTLEFRILSGDGQGNQPVAVKLLADYEPGLTALAISPGHPGLALGAKLLSEDGYILLTLAALCASGASTLTIEPSPAFLRSGQVFSLVQDITGFDLGFEVLARGGDATPVLAESDTLTIIAAQSGADRGKLQVAGLQTTPAVAALEARPYYFSLWRRNVGSARPLAEGDFVVQEQGFL